MRESSNAQESQEFQYGGEYLEYFFGYLFDKTTQVLPLTSEIMNYCFGTVFTNYCKQLIADGFSVEKAITETINSPKLEVIFLRNFLDEARDYADNKKLFFMAATQSFS